LSLSCRGGTIAIDADSIAAALRDRGLRLTRQRRAVLETVLATPSTMSPVQVFDAARVRCPELGLTTVYRTLEVLSELGALRRVHGPDHCDGFVPVGAAHGHVVVCSSCGRAREFTDCDVHEVVAAAGRQTGYLITDHFLQLSGVCPACRAGAAHPGAQEGAE